MKVKRRSPVPDSWVLTPNMTSADVADQVMRWVGLGPVEPLRIILGHARERWPGMDDEDRQRVREMLRKVGPFQRVMVHGWVTQDVVEEWQGFADWVEEQP